MPTPQLAALFNLPPKEAMAYLVAKGYRITWNWWEMQREANATAFTVAKLAQMDVMEDIRGAVQQAFEEGKTERWFRQELEPLLRKKGWWGKVVDVDPSGQAQLYQAGSTRRLQTLYRTNLQTAYMAGRQRQFDAEAARAPYVQYLAVMDSRTRPEHAALHGKVFRLDDPAWDIVAPPNGFNCRCRMRNFSERELRNRGLKVETEAEILTRTPPGKPPVDPRTGETPANWIQRGVSVPDPAGPAGSRKVLWADVGWDYAPGRSQGPRLSPPQADALPPSNWQGGSRCGGGDNAALSLSFGCPGPRPVPRPFAAARLLPSGQPDEWYVRRFLQVFGADLDRPAILEDVTGEPLRIGAELFLDRGRSARSGSPIYKVQKRGREAYLPMLAETLKSPQEIWERVEHIESLGKTVLRRRYLAWWEVEGQDKPGLAVFEWATQWWAGVTTFPPERPTPAELERYVNDQRKGVLRWRE
jgi:SPP1 gp7 family putative phage head morphogenesis protein